MDLIYIGKVVNTHGIKGEIRIVSDFKYKLDVFKENNNIYINNTKYSIKSYRKHKMFDMLVLDNINSIEDALELKNYDVYIDRNDYKFSGYLDIDLIGLDVYDNNVLKGKVIDILKTDMYDLLEVEGNKRHLIPNIDTFIKEVDIENKKIYVNYIKGLDNED